MTRGESIASPAPPVTVRGRTRRRSGVSVVEIIIVLGVLLLLAALLSPMILRLRESARMTSCRNRLRILTLGLHAYHDSHSRLPPAAIWSTEVTRSLALHQFNQVEQITHQNWAQLLLPFLGQSPLSGQFDSASPIGDRSNAVARQVQVSAMTCPSDPFNHPGNRYRIESLRSPGSTICFARGNYAINGGTHNFDTSPPSTSRPRGDFVHLLMDEGRRRFAMWGNGIAGINRSFGIEDFSNGQSTLVALEEIRAGIHPFDPRGVWSLGQIGGSITWGHGINGDNYSPNHQWPRADDILGCGTLHEVVGSKKLREERMPCVDYVDANQQATARSLHAGGVHCAFLDGSVRFISDSIDPGLWHIMHSRETPAEILGNNIEEHLSATGFFEAASHPLTAAEELPEVLVNSIGMRFSRIPAGQFEMGTPDVNNSRAPEGCPAHTVCISRPLLLSVHEVTHAQFRQVMGAGPSPLAERSGAVRPEFPVTGVTWHEASEFCERLTELEANSTGYQYRLPTEAEWEYSCRAGTSEPYVWVAKRRPGDDSGEAAGIDPPLPLTAVGSYPPNRFGLYDMRGNAWEWTADWFDRHYYARSPSMDPQGPATGYLKVVRGGDWRFVGEICLIDYPILPPWKASPLVGFRVVCSFK